MCHFICFKLRLFSYWVNNSKLDSLENFLTNREQYSQSVHNEK